MNDDVPWINPEIADPEGLVGVGGDLEPETLLRAYRGGVFPWFNDNDPILWWSPDPRAVFELDEFHIPRRLARTIRSGKFTITFDRAFAAVVRGCALADRGGTWITPEMVEAYVGLHEHGHAHSVEAWVGNELAGGIYGVAIGGFFAGESMFTRITDASKVALATLVERLRRQGFVLFDSQIINGHTQRFGATEIPRREYLSRLREAIQLPVRFMPTAT